MKLERHRRHDNHYDLRISVEDVDLTQTALATDEDGFAIFSWGAESPEGVEVADYEQSQRDEAKRLIENALTRLVVPPTNEGVVVDGEGEDL